ncbi:hypothetical protein GCM10010216_68330 [Streptomyces flaveolus]|nr:hypothetical protein GCM10010216_68330 [Streptomyces flaveolus]
MKKLRTPEVDVEHDTADGCPAAVTTTTARVRAERAPQSDITNGHRRAGGRSLDASGLFTEGRLARFPPRHERLA